MAKKSIIEIDVEDSKWKAFMESFDAYEKALGDLPDAWKKIGEAMGHSGGTLSQTAQQAMQYLSESAGHIEEMAKGLKSATKAQAQFGQASGVSRTKLKGLTKEAKDLAHSLFGIGKTLFKIGTIGTLAGVAGMFGLAESAYRRQREARGLGMSTGMVGAFRTNMQSFVNPDKMLEIGANLPYSLENIGPLALMGLNRAGMLNESPERRAFDIVNRAHELWQQGRRNQWDPMVQALEKLGLSYEDYRRIGVTPEGQIRSAEARTLHDAKTMNIDGTAQAFARLKIEIDRAGLQIESILVKGLAPLAPVFVNIAKGLTRDFVHFMNEPGTKKAVATMGQTLESFVKFLGSKDLRKDLADFGEAVKDVTGMVLNATKTYRSLHPDFNLSDWWTATKDLAWPITHGLNPVVPAKPMSNKEKLESLLPKTALKKGNPESLGAFRKPSTPKESGTMTGSDPLGILKALGVKTRPTAHKPPAFVIQNNTSADLFWSANGISH